jgi:hypothetical protein
VRDGEGGGAVVAQSNQKQNKNKNKNKNKITADAQYNKRKFGNHKQYATTTGCIKITYSRDPVLSNEKDEPKMTKARCNLRHQCRYLQCVRDGEGGAAVAAPIKPKTK